MYQQSIEALCFIRIPLTRKTGMLYLQLMSVYGGPYVAITQLHNLKAWFENQKLYHCFSTSISIVYEGGELKLLDFAHVLYDQDAIDENFLVGLNALIKMLSNIVESNSKVEA